MVLETDGTPELAAASQSRGFAFAAARGISELFPRVPASNAGCRRLGIRKLVGPGFELSFLLSRLKPTPDSRVHEPVANKSKIPATARPWDCRRGSNIAYSSGSFSRARVSDSEFAQTFKNP